MPKQHRCIEVDILASDFHTQTKEEYAAHLGEVHQSGDTRLIPIQSCEGLLPFRQDLIPSTFTGHTESKSKVAAPNGYVFFASDGSRRVWRQEDVRSNSHGSDKHGM